MKEGEVHRGLWWGELRERNHLEDLGVDGRITLKRLFKKAWIGLVWLRIRTGGRRL